jgi:hypothetical protein
MTVDQPRSARSLGAVVCYLDTQAPAECLHKATHASLLAGTLPSAHLRAPDSVHRLIDARHRGLGPHRLASDRWFITPPLLATVATRGDPATATGRASTVRVAGHSLFS